MTALIELHGARTGNCFRVAIALEESGLPYERYRVDLRQGAHRSSEFLALNPHGKVPVLIDRRVHGDLVLTQSNAIMLHLAASAPDQLAPVDGDDQRARLYERLLYFVTDVIAPSHAGFLLRSTNEEAGAVTLQRRSIVNLEASERYLEDGSFMLGDRFSLVDIAAVTIASASEDQLDWPKVPALRAWYERVMARPAVNRGFQAFTTD